MILSDSSVVIVYERAPTARLKKIIADADAAVCGVTIAELFAGVRSANDEAKLRATLADFRTLAIPDIVWETIGRNPPCRPRASPYLLLIPPWQQSQ